MRGFIWLWIPNLKSSGFIYGISLIWKNQKRVISWSVGALLARSQSLEKCVSHPMLALSFVCFHMAGEGYKIQSVLFYVVAIKQSLQNITALGLFTSRMVS